MSKKVPRAIQQKISKKIKLLMNEGYPQKQAIAIAYSMVAPKYKHNPEGPWKIYSKQKDSYGDLTVVFENSDSGKTIVSIFSEGEHSQAEHFLDALNENVIPLLHHTDTRKKKKPKNIQLELTKRLSDFDLEAIQSDIHEYEITTFHDPSVGLYGMVLGHLTPTKFVKHRTNYPKFMKELSKEDQESFKLLLAELASIIK